MSSSWSFPVVIAKNKDGNPRFCVNYRFLNQRIKADLWPIPKIQKKLVDLSNGKFCTALELFSGYWQIIFGEEFKEKDTFVCTFGAFYFDFMPFELIKALSTFQRMMEHIFRELLFF